MSEFDIEVLITPREGLLDPQGHAVENALRSLQFEDVSDVRIGRVVRLRVSAESADGARERADAMCRKLLANPVTEDYRIELEDAG